MVERITDPHRPVQIHGTGRLPDGQNGPCGVPQPATPPPPSDHTRATVLACLLVVALAVVIGALQ